MIAKEAASIAAEGIATGSSVLLENLRQKEQELDRLDMEIDVGVTEIITRVSESEARELLACMKLMIGLERISDLLVSLSESAASTLVALDPEDSRDLVQMAALLEKMLTEVGVALSSRALKKALKVLRADSEIDALRDQILRRHVSKLTKVERQTSLQVVLMTQSLERAGDHAKNLAEEICHLVTGHTVRHVLSTYDHSLERLFLEWLRHNHS